MRSLEVGESEPEDVHNDGDSRDLEQSENYIYKNERAPVSGALPIENSELFGQQPKNLCVLKITKRIYGPVYLLAPPPL